MWQSRSQYSSLVFTYLHEKATEASQNSAPSGSWTGWHVSASFPFHFSSAGAALCGYCLTSQPTTVPSLPLPRGQRFCKRGDQIYPAALKSLLTQEGMWGKQPFKLLKLHTKTSVWVSRSLQPSSQSSELEDGESFRALFKHLPTIKQRGLNLNTNCNTSSPLHVFRALYLILPEDFSCKIY